MEEKGNSGSLPSQRVKQQISVPFCWEEKPGRPKSGWSLNSAPAHPVPSSASTFAASVPFKWEEKPGTPLPHFEQSIMPDPLCVNPLVYPENPSPGGDCEHQCSGGNGNPFMDEEGDELTELDVEAFPFDTENSESNGIPSEKSGKCETWDSGSSSETDSDSDSAVSELPKSAEDVSILEFLFPLPSPELSFLNEVCYREKASYLGLHPEAGMKKLRMHQSNLMAKRAPTLGELILLSRRLSCGRQNRIPVRKRGLRLDRWQKFLTKRVHACGLFGTGVNQSITQGAP